MSHVQVYRYQVLVSLMLSSPTKDHVTAEAMRRLKEAGLSVQWTVATSEERIAELIKPVGFWRVSVQAKLHPQGVASVFTAAQGWLSQEDSYYTQ